MNQISPKKLLHSKWTSVGEDIEGIALRGKEKHFTVVKVAYDDNKRVTECKIESVMSRRVFDINWKNLKQSTLWKQGWV